MTIRSAVAVGLILSCGVLSSPSSAPSTHPAGAPQPSITVLFTPGDDCIQAIVHELDAARRSVHVQAYVLTSDPIGDALSAAKRRGLDVRVIFGSRSARGEGSEAERLLNNKVVVRVDGSHYHAHNKIMIIDRSVVITGSFNFSEKAQEENAENLLIIKGHPDVARRFNQNWAVHAKHSLPYQVVDKPGPAEGTTTVDPVEAAAGNTPVAEGQDLVYVTPHGKRYHRKDCQFARNGEAMTRQEAIKSGKTPCKVCRPD